MIPAEELRYIVGPDYVVSRRDLMVVAQAGVTPAALLESVESVPPADTSQFGGFRNSSKDPQGVPVATPRRRLRRSLSGLSPAMPRESRAVPDTRWSRYPSPPR